MRERWRLVTVQNGRRHVSSVVLNEDEARNHILSEEAMHELTGWDVEVDDRRPGQFTARHGRILRTVRAERFDAFNDHPNT